MRYSRNFEFACVLVLWRMSQADKDGIENSWMIHSDTKSDLKRPKKWDLEVKFDLLFLTHSIRKRIKEKA